MIWVLINCRTEKEITTVHAAGAEDIDIAVAAARTALKHPSWGKLPGTDRGKLLLKLADLVEENANTLATIESWDSGMYTNRFGIQNFPEGCLWSDNYFQESHINKQSDLTYEPRQMHSDITQDGQTKCREL